MKFNHKKIIAMSLNNTILKLSWGKSPNRLLLTALGLLAAGTAGAQAARPDLEFSNTSALQLLNPTLADTASKTITFVANKNNPYDTIFTEYVTPAPITATFTLKNQQFNTLPQNKLYPEGMVWGSGARINDTGSNQTAVLGGIGGSTYQPKESYFSSLSSTPGFGISNLANMGVRLTVLTQALTTYSSGTAMTNSYPLDSKNIYFGDLTITFSQPVDNPIIHFNAMGGNVGNYNDPISGVYDGEYWKLGFSARFYLPPNSGYTLTKLSGNSYFTVVNDTVKNSATYMGSDSKGGTNISGLPNNTAYQADTMYAAAGSVIVNGTNLTSVTFRVGMDGDGGFLHAPKGTFNLSNITWTLLNSFWGDGLSIGVSLPLNTVPLPVSLLNFDAYAQRQTADLQWATASEQNNMGFYVERSTDGARWSSIAFVPSQAAGGNSHALLHYSYADPNITEPVYFYRLRQTDIDGRHTYSSVRQLHFETIKNSVLTLQPNPAKGSTVIRGLSGGETIRVYDAMGSLVWEQANKGVAGTYTLSLSNWPAGLYLLSVTAANGSVELQKMVVQQ
jgi:hypothetical protein